MCKASFERVRAIVAGMGSSASTVRGVVRFVRANRGNVRARVRNTLWKSPALRVADWKAAAAARVADSDAKRAADDKVFRRRYLAGLRRREARALLVGPGIAGLLDKIDGGAARRAELVEVARLRGLVQGRAVKAAVLPKASDLGAVLIPLGDWREVVKRCKVSGVIMRGMDASISPTFRKSYGEHQEAYTDWSKGVNKPRGVRAVHDNFVRSFGLIGDGGRVLEYVVHETVGRVELPDGYAWGVDTSGLRAFRVSCPADDYHISAVDLLGADPGAAIVQRLEDNRARRELMRAAEACKAASDAGVFVCLADSLRAGNCREGTLAFSRRHGLDPARHYEAPELLAIANGEASRVRLAVTAARLRHVRELQAGVCRLSDHRAD